MKSLMLGVAAAVIVTGGLASTAVRAQGASSAAQQPVGTLFVEDVQASPSPIYGFGFGVTNITDPAGGGGGAGKANFGDISVTRTSDAASPVFFKNCVAGVHYKSVKIEVRSAGGGGTSASFTLRDAQIVGFTNANGTESVSFSYSQIEVAAGGQVSCWNRVANAGC